MSARNLSAQLRSYFALLSTVLIYVVVSGLSAAAASPVGEVRVHDLSGQVRAGKLIEISDSKIKIVGATATDWNRPDVLRVDWMPQPEALLDNSPQVLLGNGDRLGIRPQTIDAETLTAQWGRFPAWPPLAVPLETVRGALLIPPRNPLERSQAIVRLRDQRETQDIFYLSNGDRLLGQLENFQGDAFELTAATGKVSVPVATVRAFGMNPELTSFPPAKGSQALLTLSDGSVLTVQEVAFTNKEGLRCRAAFGSELQFPPEYLVSLQFLGGRVTYLAELEPKEYVSTPYLSRKWPLRKNQNAVGGPLRLGGKEYARGLGLHSQSLVTYSLNQQYTVFQATIGIDAVTEGRGSVIFRVLADGKPLFTSDVVRGKTPAIVVGPLPMKDVGQLTLAVDFADQGDILDHADWCDALLIKSAK
ncbi:MAG: NPCBM/NEW2 domain-containing protein [Planctomycetota bacterium]